MMQSDYKRSRLRVHGRVQGVGFRWFVVGIASDLKLGGWVRNASDGSVELEAEGSADAVAELLRRLEKGPPAARVTLIEELAPGDHELPAEFEIVR